MLEKSYLTFKYAINKKMKSLNIYFFNNSDYKKCFHLQTILREHLLKIPNKNFFVITSHQDVITFGKNRIETDLLVDNKFLEEKKIKIVSSNRGGKITFHGKGQLVFYLIINLKDFNLTVKDYVYNLEQVGINTLKHFGISSFRQDGKEGLWVLLENKIQKIGFIGIHIRRYCTIHGLSINIEKEILKNFSLINPCGYKNIYVTSLENILKEKISSNEFILYFINEFLKIFNFDKVNNKCKLSAE